MKPLLPSVLLPLALSSAAFAQSPPAPSPTPQQLLNLRLHDGFTLTYQVMVHDVRTAALRAKDVTDQQEFIKRAVAEGHMTRQEADDYQKQGLTLGQHQPDVHFQITLTARDGKLLYLSNRSARDQKNGTKSAIVLEGDKEYESADATGALINNDAWRNAPVYRDENVDRLAFCPMPGGGLPNVDLIQAPLPPSRLPGGHFLYQGAVPRLNWIDDETPYRAGSVETALDQGRLKVVRLTVGLPSVSQQTWQMTGFRLFQGHWLATRMQWTEYEASSAEAGEKLTSDLPTATADYKLIEARPTALDASALEIGTYLRNQASVSDNSTGITLTFAYNKNGRTLKEQSEAARKKVPEKDLGKDLKTP